MTYASDILDDMRRMRDAELARGELAFQVPVVWLSRSQYSALRRMDRSGHGYEPPPCKRASKGWRRHIRRLKADKRRGS